MIRGSNFAQFSKCSECDKNSAIASVSFSWFRRYIYFHKRSPYGGDIAIWPPSQTGKNLGCWLYLSVQSVRPCGRAVPSWWCGSLMTWHIFIGWFFDESCVDMCSDCWKMGWGRMAQSGGATCHSLFGYWFYIKYNGGHGVWPPDLPQHKPLQTSARPLRHYLFLDM